MSSTDTTLSPRPRLVLLDALRGFALLGVLLVHIYGEFAGWGDISKARMAAMPTADLDPWVAMAVTFFWKNKARALFSFAFGCAFYFQLQAAERRGTAIGPRFLQRMTLLLLIGVAHMVLLYGADIFTIYAPCGAALLLFWRAAPRRLLVVGLLLTTLVPSLGIVATTFLPDAQFDPATFERAYALYTSSRYADVVAANVLIAKTLKLDPYYHICFVLPVLGYFLLGLWAMQTRLLERLVQDSAYWRRVIWPALGLGLAGMTLQAVLRMYNGGQWGSLLPLQLLRAAVMPAATVALAFAYVGGFAWLARTGQLTRGLAAALIPVGQMTLTNYVMHSVMALVLFSGVGLGWGGTMGPTLTVPLGVALFGLQVIYSRWWLRHFTAGPLEYLWRCALRGQWQPWRRVPEPAAVPA